MARTTQTFNDVAEDVRYHGTNIKDSETKDYALLPADKVKPSPFNEGLDMDNVQRYAQSMKESGLFEPIVVYDKKDGTYEILTGHQRFEAWCHVLGHSTIKAVIRPYEPDPIKRFKAHTEANTLNRNHDIRFWNSRIHQARIVLAQTGFSGSKAEEMQKLSEMLNGISQAQLYRYQNFAKLIPELQQFESRHWLSAMTLYAAAGLDEEQQRKVAEIVNRKYEEEKEKRDERHADFEVTREEFVAIVKAVKAGEEKERKPKRSTYAERISTRGEALLKIVGNPKTEEDKADALREVGELIDRLQKVKEKLSQ